MHLYVKSLCCVFSWEAPDLGELIVDMEREGIYT